MKQSREAIRLKAKRNPMKKLRKKVEIPNKGIKRFLILNFTDRAGRIDTGRIGQLLGLFFMLCISSYTAAMVMSGTYMTVQTAVMASIVSAFPMLLYRLKEFGGPASAKYDYPPFEDPKIFKKTHNFLRKNFTDEYGRIDTGRIGQVIGLFYMVVLCIFVSYIYILYPTFHSGEQATIQTDHLMLLGSDAGFPMLMYRLKQFAGRSFSNESKDEDDEDDEDDHEGTDTPKSIKGKGA